MIFQQAHTTLSTIYQDDKTILSKRGELYPARAEQLWTMAYNFSLTKDAYELKRDSD